MNQMARINYQSWIILMAVTSTIFWAESVYYYACNSDANRKLFNDQINKFSACKKEKNKNMARNIYS